MQTPVPLNLPTYEMKLRQDQGKLYVYDELRKKYLVLTPEEWVRQHWIHYLIKHKQYPKGLIQTEGGLTLNTLQKRTDLVIFNRAGKRCAIVELKAPSIKITQKTFDQIARYNMVHRVSYLVVSNGLEHYYCHIDHEQGSYRFLEKLPDYSELTREG